MYILQKCSWNQTCEIWYLKKENLCFKEPPTIQCHKDTIHVIFIWTSLIFFYNKFDLFICFKTKFEKYSTIICINNEKQYIIVKC